MKRFIAQLNDGGYINVPADRMEIRDNQLYAWNGKELVAYIDTGAVVCAHLSEKG